MSDSPSLHVSEPWLAYIKSGVKTVEGRQMNFNKFLKFMRAKKVRFYNENDEVWVRVVAVHWYNDLYHYLDQEGWENVVPGLNSLDEAIDTYHKFYSDESIHDHGGMCGLKVELIEE